MSRANDDCRVWKSAIRLEVFYFGSPVRSHWQASIRMQNCALFGTGESVKEALENMLRQLGGASTNEPSDVVPVTDSYFV